MTAIQSISTPRWGQWSTLIVCLATICPSAIWVRAFVEPHCGVGWKNPKIKYKESLRSPGPENKGDLGQENNLTCCARAVAARQLVEKALGGGRSVVTNLREFRDAGVTDLTKAPIRYQPPEETTENDECKMRSAESSGTVRT